MEQLKVSPLEEAKRISEIGTQDKSLEQELTMDVEVIQSSVWDDQEFLLNLKSIPDKMAFKIGEVADLLGVKQYVLRYWETEFEELKPRKGKNNQRMYNRKNVETALLIQKLLHKDRFSIEGARKIMKERKEQIRRAQEFEGFSKGLRKVMLELKALQSDVQSLKSLIN